MTTVIVLFNPFKFAIGYVYLYAIIEFVLAGVPILGLVAYYKKSLRVQDWFAKLVIGIGLFLLMSILIDTDWWNLPTFVAIVYLAYKGYFFRNLLAGNKKNQFSF